MSPKRRSRSHSSSAHHDAPLIIRVIRKVFTTLFVFGILLLLGFGFLWWMGDSLFQLKTDANIVFVNNTLDGKEAKIYFAQFLQEEQRITVQAIDPQQSVTVIGGYGEYLLPKVYPLLKLEKKNSFFSRAAMSWVMGGVVDQVVAVDNQQPLSKKNLEKILSSQLYKQGLHWDSATRMAQLYFFARSAPDELVTINADPVALTKLTDALYEPTNNECTVAVVNTTHVPRLATRISDILEKSGTTVIRLDDMETEHEASSILVDPNQSGCLDEAERIKAVFPFEISTSDQPEVRKEHRADIVIVLGKDLGEVVAP
jgi:hypothetical protein